MKQSVFCPADILLPKSEYDMHKWSVVACDQYTSDAEYWNTVNAIAGEAPSALRIILPELYLNAPDKEERIQKIRETMEVYAEEVLEAHPQTMIYVERTMTNGAVRHGIVGAIDLEAYDYNKGASSAIRATEGTVLSRIPPRVQVRENAILESPHVMILVDDREYAMFRAAEKAKAAGAPVYDFDLMQNGGHITGWKLPADCMEDVDTAADALSDPAAFAARYGEGYAPLVYAVGDGNHSLATAKACYENLKKTLGEEAAKAHPARYALAEIVILNDDALVFEPIYRVVFHVNAEELLQAMAAYYPGLCVCEGEGAVLTADAQVFTMLYGDQKKTLTVPRPTQQLPVGTLQAFLDSYLTAHPEAEVDYIHGEGAVASLVEKSKEDTVGFLFSGMTKDALFKTVLYDGVLPRKTFSMGAADEKRYYLECRRIR